VKHVSISLKTEVETTDYTAQHSRNQRGGNLELRKSGMDTSPSLREFLSSRYSSQEDTKLANSGTDCTDREADGQRPRLPASLREALQAGSTRWIHGHCCSRPVISVSSVVCRVPERRSVGHRAR
jgi:hypothetical protein